MSTSTVIISSNSHKEAAERRAAHEQELQSLAVLISQSSQGRVRDAAVADLLAFLDVIHNTPTAKQTWIDRT